MYAQLERVTHNTSMFSLTLYNRIHYVSVLLSWRGTFVHV